MLSSFWHSSRIKPPKSSPNVDECSGCSQPDKENLSTVPRQCYLCLPDGACMRYVTFGSASHPKYPYHLLCCCHLQGSDINCAIGCSRLSRRCLRLHNHAREARSHISSCADCMNVLSPAIIQLVLLLVHNMQRKLPWAGEGPIPRPKAPPGWIAPSFSPFLRPASLLLRHTQRQISCVCGVSPSRSPLVPSNVESYGETLAYVMHVLSMRHSGTCRWYDVIRIPCPLLSLVHKPYADTCLGLL
jgi:hypothetical protein